MHLPPIAGIGYKVNLQDWYGYFVIPHHNKSYWLIGNSMNIWRLETCKAATGYRSTASIYQLIKKGLWPKPVNINGRSVGWPDAEILAINAARIAGQTDDQIRELVQSLHAKRNNIFNSLTQK